MRKHISVMAIVFLSLAACQEKHGVPKPRAYPKVLYPERSSVPFHHADCPFTFDYPGYAEVVIKKEHPCWFNLHMQAFNATLHCSYLPVKDRADFDDMVSDVFKIAKQINERANYMEETHIESDHGAAGLALHWTGPAASPFHFFLSDTTQHFFKASLYFEAEVHPDSLAPIVQFVEEDMNKLIRSFAWEK